MPADTSMTSGPIFIVGMNGSGTTMLADCLNYHPLIFIPHFEGKVIPYFYQHAADYGDLNEQDNFTRLLKDFSGSHAFYRLSKKPGGTIQYDFSQLAEKTVATAIDLTFSHFSRKEGKIIWGDHSPKYALCLSILTELFPQAKIIHIIRDGRDCALSFHRRFKQNIFRSMHQWKNIVRKARHDGRKLGQDRYIEVYYEELSTNSEQQMKHICEFLEIPFDTSVLQSNMPMYQNRDKNSFQPGTIVPNTGKWRTGFSENQITELERLAGQTLQDFCYKTISQPGDEDLSDLNLFIYTWVDKIHSARIYCKNYSGDHLFTDLLRLVRAALRQMKYDNS